MAIVVNDQTLQAFTERVFATFGLSESEAHICADNLVTADLRGIPSHGVARLKRYVDGIANGVIFPLNKPKIERQTASTATVDGAAGLGQLVGHFATELAIKKAEQNGIGMVAVRNSNHYGIAGYYTSMILEKNMLGLSMTNSAPLVVPTFSREMVVGTNPISLGAPAKRNRPFFMDMATSVVPRGKLEVYDRAEKPLPEGWAVDTGGAVTTDAAQVLKNMLSRAGGGILPLGGEGELYSGYKGYGMAVFVDVFCGVLSGGAYATLVNRKEKGAQIPADVGHFFMALRIENFVDLSTFTEKMDDLIERLKGSSKAEGAERVYIHGEKEYELFDKHKREGVPLSEKVFETLKGIADDRGVEFDLS